MKTKHITCPHCKGQKYSRHLCCHIASGYDSTKIFPICTCCTCNGTGFLYYNSDEEIIQCESCKNGLSRSHESFIASGCLKAGIQPYGFTPIRCSECKGTGYFRIPKEKPIENKIKPSCQLNPFQKDPGFCEGCSL